ncbi:MAG: HD domain-containing protein [FCB group bacterium]|nr:HD domain-containing protein [FCB group bacterium]
MNSKRTLTDKFLPIYLEALRIDSVIDFDLYLSIGHDLVLYRAADLPFTEKTRATLLDNNIKQLFIPGGERSRYQTYIESNINQIIEDREIPETTKAGIVYDSTKLLVKDVLDNPTLSDNIRRSKDLVESSVNFVIKGQDAFHNLLMVMSFDYYTYTHSVNVCTFAVAFARHLGYSDEDFLINLGTGALLHDVGKTKISDRILNKRSRLSPLELELIRKHPQWGVDLIRDTNLVHDSSYYAILQHHERDDQSGYPAGLRGEDIHIYGKITGIADSFDAMTTRRVYQNAVETYPALKALFERENAFDRNLLEQFALLMGPREMAQL